MNTLYSTVSLAALMLATAATAQTGGPPNNQASAPIGQVGTDQNASASAQAGANVASPPGGLEEIIVTANRRRENLQDVPIAVAAVTPTQLVNSGVSNIQGLSVLVPGVQLLQGAATANPYIRGVGSQQVGPGLESPVALYVDGVYYASTFGAPADLNDVAQVEVLKGPQGTLFGRNATGGLINITTRTPSADTHVEGDLSYGNYNTVKGDVYATTGVGPHLAVDFAGVASHQGDGYGRNILTGQDLYKVDLDLNLRSKWLLTPVEGTRITAIFDYDEIRSSLNAARIIPGTLVPPIIGPIYGGRVWDAALSTQPILNQKGGGASLKIEQDLGFGQLVNTAAYRQSHTNGQLDLDATATNFTSVNPVIQNEYEITEELQLQSTKSRHFNWTVGAFYFYDNAKIDETVLFGPTVSPIFTGQRYFGRQETQSIAGYGQATWEFLPATHLTLGGRYTYETRDFLGDTYVLRGPVQIPTLANFVSSKNYDRFTYRAALDHRFSDAILGYVAVNSGFKSGGYNALAPTQSPFNPEKLTAYAAGLKTDLFDRKVRFNVEGFYYDYKDLQVAVVLQLAPGVTAPGIINGGGAHVYGLDADLQAQLTEHFRLSGGIEYLHSRFVDTAANFAISSPAGNLPTHLGSVSGNTLPYSPDFVGNIAGDYSFDLGPGKANLNVTYQLNDGYFTEPDNVIKQSSFSMLNASIRWKPEGEHYSISAWVKNATNAAVIQNALTLAFGPHEAYYLPPRTFGATVGFSF